MMLGLWAVFTFILVAALTETIIFRKRRALLKKNQQCFQFHDFRDRLQLLTIEGKIQPNSELYAFLLFTVNVAIRNAGEFKLRHLLDVSRTVKKQTRRKKLEEHIRDYSPEVQALASEVCNSFALMLVANDDLAIWLFKGLGILTRMTNGAIVNAVKFVVSRLAPEHVKVVREANEYSRLGQRLTPSY